jgi:hypothetical protein
VKEFLSGRPDSYRRDIVDFLFDDFDIIVGVDCVSKMLKREHISRKKVRLNLILSHFTFLFSIQRSEL